MRPETFQERAQHDAAYSRTATAVRPILNGLRVNLARRQELVTYREALRDPSFAERAARAWHEWIYVPIVAIVAAFSVPFDALYTFSTVAAYLAPGIAGMVGIKDAHLATSIGLSLVVLVVTIAIRVTTDARFDEAVRNDLPADSPRIAELTRSIARKGRVRRWWIGTLAAMLITAATSEVITARVANDLGNRYAQDQRGGTEAGSSTLESFAGVVALATPFLVTYGLHLLILFIPLPLGAQNGHFPCSPARVDTRLTQVGIAIRDQSRQLYDAIMSAPTEATRGRLASALSESERRAVNEALEREVFRGATGNAPAAAAPPPPTDPTSPPASATPSPSFEGVL